jgi:hypothetical protein
MVTSRDYGKKVRVELKGTGEAVEGWLLEETPRGLYLSLDPDGKVIRLVQQDTVRVIFDIRDVGKAPFVPPDHEENAKKIEDLAKKIDRPVRDALDRLDHNRTKRLAVTIRDTLDQLEGYRFEESKRDIPGTELPPYGLFVSARNTHAEVLDEVRRSGLEDVLRANASSLRQVISRDTLPQMDSEAVPLAEVDEMIKLTREQDLLSETDFGRQWVYQPITINIQVGVPPQPPTGPATPKHERDHIRSVTGWMKVLSGGALAVTNLGAGVVAGIVVGLPTLGWGTVPIALGVANSTFTGLNAAADALRGIYTHPEQ